MDTKRTIDARFDVAVSVALLVVANASAATRYVWQDSPSPTPPYITWATAAHVIQDAVDAAVAGDEIVVTNGVYATGGRAVVGTLTNRVAVDKPLSLFSVNGPAVTIIQGYQVPGTTNDDGAIRCVYLTNGASLSGFTLTNGATRYSGDVREYTGGGLWCESIGVVVSNCLVTGNSAGYAGGVSGGTLNNCVLTSNSALEDGGGAHLATLNGCTLTGNSAGEPASLFGSGGGAFDCTLNNCVLTGNSAGNGGGGAIGGTLDNCTLNGNSANSGGGAEECILNNCNLTGNMADCCGGGAIFSALKDCVLTGNSAGGGGGVNFCTLDNCTLAGNWAGEDGGGAYESRLNNCTLTGNSATNFGGGARFGTLHNCIVLFNMAPHGSNYVGRDFNPVVLNYCCTTPLPTNGVGNITNAPLFVNLAAGNLRLQPNSPCINAGNNAYVTNSTDLDGNPRITGGTVDMGAYEFQPSAGVRYVNLSNAMPAPPYTTWATAARIIQDAVDAAESGDLVLVTNGVYAAGGRAVHGTMTNRVVVDRPVRVQSANGSEVTIIQGAKAVGGGNGNGAIRCVYLTNGASLSGFTLTNGATRSAGDSTRERSGGGVWCESTNAAISNCVLIANSAISGGGVFGGRLNDCILTRNFAGSFGILLGGGGAASSTLNNCTLTLNAAGGSEGPGGGAFECTLNNCTLRDNSAVNGGGAWFSTLNNCTVARNNADLAGGAYGGALNNCVVVCNQGGGVTSGTLNNCIVYFNRSGGNYDNTYDVPLLNYCCTTPLPTNGVGNITNAPIFVDTNGWSNLRLQSNSPCINAGGNAFVTNSTDLDGNPRIAGGTVDMGAYEFQSPSSVLSYAWAQQYGLPTDGFADFGDTDHDGHNNWQEWKAWTNPSNALSVLKLLTPQPATNGMLLRWQSASGQNYFLERATSAAAPFSLFQSNLVGQAGVTSFTDTNAAGLGTAVYRVGVPK